MRFAPLLPFLFAAAAIACNASMESGSDAEKIVVEPVDPTTLAMSDVSILFPVPAPGADPLLRPSSSGDQGPLIPPALLRGLGRVIATGANEDLRVVSARVDPCFPDLALLETHPNDCRRQIRLVLQPRGRTSGFSDAAVHLLFDLDKGDFAEMVSELARLGDRSPEHRADPLAVHPVMSLPSEGADGPAARAINAVILRHAGEKRLVRIAVMSLDDPDAEWNFKAFNVAAGALVADTIPLLGATKVQQVTKGLPETGITFEMEMHPASTHGDAIAPLLRESGIPEVAADAFDKALEAAFFTEHPAKSNPVSIDCASCHMAPSARLLAERVRSVSTLADARRFTSTRNLTLSSPESSQKLPNMRAFGYFGKNAAISPRTVNETAAVLDALAKYGMGASR